MNLPGAVKGTFVADAQLEPVLLRAQDGRVYQLRLNGVSENLEMAVLELVDTQTRVVHMFEARIAGRVEPSEEQKRDGN